MEEFVDVIQGYDITDWLLPYDDLVERGIYRSFYSNETFNSSYFAEKKDAVEEWERHLYFKKEKGAMKTDEYTSQHSLCQEGDNKKYYRIRGLCKESKLDRLYLPSNLGWQGLGRFKTHVFGRTEKYHTGTGTSSHYLLLISIKNNVYAIVNTTRHGPRLISIIKSI